MDNNIRIWFICFVVLFALSQLFDWVQQLSLPLPIYILGGAFLPASLFPQTLLDIAEFNPIFHMNEALTEISANNSEIADIASHLQFLAWFALIVVIGGCLSYRRMLMAERKL